MQQRAAGYTPVSDPILAMKAALHAPWIFAISILLLLLAAVVFFYGGSWKTGKRNEHRFVGSALAAQWIAMLVLELNDAGLDIDTFMIASRLGEICDEPLRSVLEEGENHLENATAE